MMCYVQNFTVFLFLRSLDKNVKLPFTVFPECDLNKSPNLKNPYGVSGEQVICCAPCQSEPVSLC